MKAMSLRISMQTLSPCLTPSFSSPLAIRSARSATSAWLRRRAPLMMPWNKETVAIVVFRSRAGLQVGPHGEERVFARLEPWATGLILRDALRAPQDEGLTFSPPPQTAARVFPYWRGQLRSGSDCPAASVARPIQRAAPDRDRPTVC